MGVNLSRVGRPPPASRLDIVADYLNATIESLYEMREVYTTVCTPQRPDRQPRIPQEEFDLVFGVILKDADVHFPIFDHAGRGVNPYECFCALLFADQRASYHEKIDFFFQLFSVPSALSRDRSRLHLALNVFCATVTRITGLPIPKDKMVDEILNDVGFREGKQPDNIELEVEIDDYLAGAQKLLLTVEVDGRETYLGTVMASDWKLPYSPELIRAKLDKLMVRDASSSSSGGGGGV
eukprot:g3374.t1